MSYKNLEIWKLAKELSNKVHTMTLKELPKFEMYEKGSQIRRSAHSVRANIVEGFGRKRYQQEFIRFLVFSDASLHETRDHLESLIETGSLKNETLFRELDILIDELGRKLNRFIAAVEKNKGK